MGDLVQGAEQLKGLAQTLDGFCGLHARAEADEIKLVAIGVRATAVQALLTASTAVGKPTTPTTDGGAGGALNTGSDRRLAQAEISKHSTNVSPTMTSPRRRSVRRNSES